MLTKAVAYSQIENSLEAGKSCALSIREKFGECAIDCLFLFATIGYDFKQLLSGIREILPDTSLCGCSGAGSITNLGCDESLHSVGLMGLGSDRIQFSPFMIPNLGDNPQKAGEKVGQFVRDRQIEPTEDKLLFLFPDGFTMYADALYKGIETQLDAPVDMVGGTAGNDYSNEDTYQFCNDRVLKDAVAGVLLTGQFNYKIRVSHGSKPLGNHKTVTRSQGNIIYEIDEKPALEHLRDVFGEEQFALFTSDMSAIGLNLIGLGVPFEGKDYSENILVRAILRTDPAEKSLIVGTEMPVGSVFRMTRRDRNQVLEATRNMVEEVVEGLQSPDDAAYFYFNCVGRGEHLFGEPEPDVNEALETLDDDRDAIGFFSFGEIAPVMGEQQFHNYTGVFVGIETE
ncbi:MAG: FIST N-terminal domain-containing protein [Cyanobacteria bacterium P01_E01_bin.42]